MPDAVLPEDAKLDDVPAYLAHLVVYLYDHTPWPLFVRFTFSIALSDPRYQPRLRELFVERASSGLRALMKTFVDRGEIGEDDAVHLTRAVLNAVGLLMIERRIVYPGEGEMTDARVFADFVGRIFRAGLSAVRDPAGP